MQGPMPPPPEPVVTRAEFFRPRPSNAVVVSLMIVAAVMLLVGVIILQAKSLSESPGYGTPEYTNWSRMIRNVTFAGDLVLDLGVFFLLLVGLSSAILRVDLPDKLRGTLIVMPVVLAIVWLLTFFLT